MTDNEKNIRVVLTDSTNDDFLKLISLLDMDLEQRYGTFLQNKHKKYNQVDFIKDVVLIYKDNAAVACGAFREHDSNSAEIKRVFVIAEQRKKGLAKLVIALLEEQARLKGYSNTVLETGIGQPEAINLYKSIGYEIIPNFEPYIEFKTSVCMKKAL